MATTLGLSFWFHDSAAALVRGGRPVAAVAEERLSRKKHDAGFPALAMDWCLSTLAPGIAALEQLDAVVHYEKPVVKLARIVESAVAGWPRTFWPWVRALPRFLTHRLRVKREIRRHLARTGLAGWPLRASGHDSLDEAWRALPAAERRDRNRAAARVPVLFLPHHLSHASAAFFGSGWDEAAILTLDGVGEWDTAAIGQGRGNTIALAESMHFPHSIGLFYAALTAYLGFRVNDGEWKVMGLAPYGEPSLVPRLRELLDTRPDGSLGLNLRYFAHHRSMTESYVRREWERLLGFPPRDPKSDEAEIAQRYRDLARSGQALCEEWILGAARRARERTGLRRLCIAGGVGLNSVANWKIREAGIFDEVWVQPAAGDDGGAVGAALFASRALGGDPAPAGPADAMSGALLGPAYSDEEIAAFLQANEIPHRHLGGDEAIAQAAAEAVAAKQVVGWFSGRAEFGPRALGSRSILADATDAESKARINAKIKYREFFRPFAPAVAHESAHLWFEMPPGLDLPYMLMVPRVRPEQRARLAAVTHVDGTGRVQTVRRESNPRYHAVLMALERLTGVPVVLNTSFNVRGEPIVCTPADAYRCFCLTGIDVLIMGPYWIDTKPASPDAVSGWQRSDALEAGAGLGEGAGTWD